MTRANKIIYWIATIWIALGMTSSSIVQLVRVAEAEANMLRLGYPSYMMTILGVWKALGVIVILAPRLLRC